MAVMRKVQFKPRGVRLEVHNDMVRFPYHDPECLVCLHPGSAPGEPLRKGLGSKRELSRGIFLGHLMLISRHYLRLWDRILELLYQTILTFQLFLAKTQVLLGVSQIYLVVDTNLSMILTGFRVLSLL